MKIIVKTTKLLLVLFFIICFQKIDLFAVTSLQELTARRIAESIDVNEFIGGLISGNADTFKFLEDVCKTQEERQGFAYGLLPYFLVDHKIFVADKSCVSCVAWSSDGKYIAGGSEDRSIRVFDLETEKCIMAFVGHENVVTAVSWSFDGKYLASGSKDKTVRVWDLKAGRCIKVFNGHEDRVGPVAWSPDGKHIASGSDDRTVRVWDVEAEKCVGVFHGYRHWVDLVGWSPDGKNIVSQSVSPTITWNIETGESKIVSDYAEVRDWRFEFTGLGKSRPDGKLIAYVGTQEKPFLTVCRKITDLNQVLIILILKYLEAHNQMDNCYAIFDQPHLNFLVEAWNQFNETEQVYLRRIFGIDGI